MKRKLTWTDTEDLALALADRFPEMNPLTVRFTDLHRWAMEIDGFDDDAGASNEKKLEALQMAWYEEWQDRQG